MSVSAVAEGVRLSPRKAGLVAALIRGRSVADAIVILEHTPKKGAGLIKKVVLSARANATHNHSLKDAGLIISELTIGPSVALKRFKPVAFGRAHPYKHRTSNIRVVLEGNPESAKPSDKRTKRALQKTPAKAEKP